MNLDVRFHSNGRTFKTDFDQATPKRIPAKFSEVSVVSVGKEPDYYEGDYKVTPRVDAQTLPTADKTMREDLTVKAIPVYNVSNTAGGSTFYIATMGEEPDGGIAVLGKMKLGTTVL